MAIVVLGSTPSQPKWPTVKAAYEAGLTAYKSQRYADAVVAFEAAYKLRDSPGLLLNLAESHKRLGDCRTALAYYDRFTSIVSEGLLSAEVDSRARTLRATCNPEAPQAPLTPEKKPAPAHQNRPLNGLNSNLVTLRAMPRRTSSYRPQKTPRIGNLESKSASQTANGVPPKPRN